MRAALTLAFVLAFGLAAAQCRAQDNAELAGLKLADALPAEAAANTTSGLRLSLEPAWQWARQRGSGAIRPAQRISLDLALQLPLGTGLRLLAGNRLDLFGPAPASDAREVVNSLKELFVNWRASTTADVDIGRVNARFGVAAGYNPTDYLREQAVRSVVSADPSSLRENRLGTAMLRAQHVWNSGSLTAIVAPRLAAAPSKAAWSADFGATNQRNRVLLAWTQRWGPDFAPQWLLLADEQPGTGPQLGLNVTRLLNRACVAHLEWSGGRSASLMARARAQSLSAVLADTAMHSQWSAGGTCTSAGNLTLTLEWQHNGAALDRAGWRALREGPSPLYAAYRQQGQMLQDPSTRDSLFAMLRRQNAFMPQLDMLAFLRLNLADRSSVAWAEARYHWPRTEVALQGQWQRGDASSKFGASASSQSWQLLLRHYF